MKITQVNPLSEYKLKTTFDDGVSGIINLKDFITHGIFKVLQNQEIFNSVYTNGYSVAWSDELEIDALTIYAELLKKDPEDLFTGNYKYATN